MTLADKSALELRQLLELRELSPREVVDHFLEISLQLNRALSAFTVITADAARQRADELTAQKERPTRLAQPLWGLPFADKDLNHREGLVTTFGSAAFPNFVAPNSSPITQDLDAAGGVSLGKTNVPEFGFPSYGYNELPTGYAKNPWDPALDPGGSSSGAATAVAARMLPLAPGNDAGGSVRIPAAATGLVGLKPSRGRVPGESGLAGLAGLPVGGPLAVTTLDAALLLDAMVSGPHRYSLRAPQPPYMADSGSFVDAAQLPVPRLRVGWTTWSPWGTHYGTSVDDQATEVFEDTLEMVRQLGHRVQEVKPRPFPNYVDAFRAVLMGGAAGLPITEDMLPNVGTLTAWLIEKGRRQDPAALPAALASLSEFEAQVIADFAPYDVVLTPALAQTPRPPSWYSQVDGEANFAQQVEYTPFTSFVNVAGLPAISMPVGQGVSEITGATVPLGVQGIGRPGDEATLLRLSYQLEQQVDWQRRVPPVAG